MSDTRVHTCNLGQDVQKVGALCKQKSTKGFHATLYLILSYGSIFGGPCGCYYSKAALTGNKKEAYVLVITSGMSTSQGLKTVVNIQGPGRMSPPVGCYPKISRSSSYRNQSTPLCRFTGYSSTQPFDRRKMGCVMRYNNISLAQVVQLPRIWLLNSSRYVIFH